MCIVEDAVPVYIPVNIGTIDVCNFIQQKGGLQKNTIQK
jgi:hypothetical protein